MAVELRLPCLLHILGTFCYQSLHIDLSLMEMNLYDEIDNINAPTKNPTTILTITFITRFKGAFVSSHSERPRTGDESL